MLCVQHPRVGIRCIRCMPSHVERHSDSEELTCDVCRILTTEICGAGMPYRVSGIDVRQPRGSRGSISGVVGVIGLGMCDGCAGDEVHLASICPVCGAEVTQGKCWGCGRPPT